MLVQKGICIWCLKPMQTERRRDCDFATFEHLKRKRLGGTDALANLVLACRYCNEHRS
jgi:5-methylcytosine-specific restriction endonuclease McrA